MLLQSRNKEKDYSELTQRVRTWWIIVAILLTALISGKIGTLVTFGFINFLAMKELLSIIPTRLYDRRAIFWAYLSIPVQYYWIGIQWYTMFLIFIPVYLFLFIPIRMVLIGQTKGFIRSAGVIHWVTMLTVFCLSHMAYLTVLPVQNNAAGPVGALLFLLALTQLNDVFQYVFGKLFGKTKIVPLVSPNKTWEGFIGGLVTVSILSTIMAPYLTPLSSLHGLFIGSIIAVAGFFGDLVISAVKRDLQIKDCSSLLSGHGGAMDRLDSLTYTAPIFFHYLIYFYY